MNPWLLATSVAVVLTQFPTTARPGGSPCVRYEPDTVAVSGTLTRMTFPGRPNYESIKDGDEPETGFYLRAVTPICTIGSADSMMTDEGTLRGVRLVQLLLDSAGYARLRPKLGELMTLRGRLSVGGTAHYHAPLALEVLWPR
ncbi:MAG TPA: hypothetical protein VJS20_11305 [Gemmatimonadales bacterium]|nr:hypothetical protein [Gemmatimonadales bacterium]